MYSKTEVCFTLILAAGASWYLNSQHAAAQVGIQGGGLSIADGGHPPPPPDPPTPNLKGAELLQTDGGHPPPPPDPPSPNLKVTIAAG